MFLLVDVPWLSSFLQETDHLQIASYSKKITCIIVFASYHQLFHHKMNTRQQYISENIPGIQSLIIQYVKDGEIHLI